jgi:hypothetical protein
MMANTSPRDVIAQLRSSMSPQDSRCPSSKMKLLTRMEISTSVVSASVLMDDISRPEQKIN